MIAECPRDCDRGSGYDVSMTNRHGDRSTTPEIPILLPRGAFLVECSSGRTVSDDQLSGRVEHIVSGRATSFESTGTLIDFIRGVLAALGQVNGAAGDMSPGHHDLDGPPSRRST
jgi:hypothetical protein